MNFLYEGSCHNSTKETDRKPIQDSLLAAAVIVKYRKKRLPNEALPVTNPLLHRFNNSTDLGLDLHSLA